MIDEPPSALVAMLAGAGARRRGRRGRGQAKPAEGWRTFAGSWSARGRRQTLPDRRRPRRRRSSTCPARSCSRRRELGGGLLGEAIAFDDGQDLSVGRAVWTDARGDRVFSELRGEPVATGRRVVGTITGGTGRYAGVIGDYALTWQYVAPDDDDVVQGRAVDLRGRFRKANAVTSVRRPADEPSSCPP